MACCALAAFLITQWIVLFRAIRRTVAGWRVPQALLFAGMLFAGAQTALFVWSMVQPGHDHGSPVASSEAVAAHGHHGE
jgi:hypothetical protein